MKGIFCSNFAYPHSNWTACHQVWCGECYVPSTTVHFFHFQATDEEGYHWGTNMIPTIMLLLGMVTTWSHPSNAIYVCFGTYTITIQDSMIIC
jgi:hypothetical protein